jgi:hypothetical protein
MINGTPCQGPDVGMQGVVGHWTYGCGGTTGFLIHVLKAINLPVKRVYAGSVSPICLHNTTYFMTIDKYLSHGDDPYDRVSSNDPPLPGGELLIPSWQFSSWFPPKAQDPNGEVCSRNVGRRPIEVAVQSRCTARTDRARRRASRGRCSSPCR